jgi:hypothetical protein
MWNCMLWRLDKQVVGVGRIWTSDFGGFGRVSWLTLGSLFLFLIIRIAHGQPCFGCRYLCMVLERVPPLSRGLIDAVGLGEKTLQPDKQDLQDDSGYSRSKQTAYEPNRHGEVEVCRSRQVGGACECADWLSGAIDDGCVEEDEQKQEEEQPPVPHIHFQSRLRYNRPENLPRDKQQGNSPP